MTRKLTVTLLALVATLAFYTSSHAATITAFEELIGDPGCTLTSLSNCETGAQDLSRIRQDGAGPLMVETNDAVLAGAPGAGGAGGNLLPASFGVFDTVDFSYVHSLTWLSATTFLDATLTIYAYDVDGGNDQVIANAVALNLVNGNNTISVTSFGTIQAQIVGNLLSVSIDKNPNNPVANNDQINVFRSILAVSYDDGTAQLPGVPEPGTWLLVATGLGLAAIRARRRK